MVSRFSELVVGCHDPKRLAAFWCAVLDYHVLDEEPGTLVEIGPRDLPTDDDFAEWRRRLRTAPSPPSILFIAVPEGKTVKNRLHIDVNPIDATTEEEAARLRALGATDADIGQGPDVTWKVMQDPEGNEFCVLRSLTP